MKKFLCSLACVGMLALTGVADAAVKTFAALKVDVPTGWREQAQGPAVILTAPDQASTIMVVCAPDEQSAKAAAIKISSAVQGSTPVAEGKGYTFTFKQQGQEGMMYIAKIEGWLVLATLGGKNADFLKIAKSVVPFRE